MGVLSAVYPAALHLLGNLQGNPALAQLNKCHNNRHHNAGDDDHDEFNPSAQAGIHHTGAERVNDSVRDVGNDTDKDQQGDTVADSLFGNPLADPHGQGGTACHGDADQRVVQPAAAVQNLQGTDQADGLQRSQDNRHIPGNPVDLLAAVLFLAQPLQRGNRDGQQLHDNAGVDVGCNTHSHDGHPLESAACHHAEQTECASAGSSQCELFLYGRQVNAGRRNHTDQPEQKQHQEGVDDFPSEFGDLPHFPDTFDHVRSPRPFRRPPRSFPSRSR